MVGQLVMQQAAVTTVGLGGVVMLMLSMKKPTETGIWLQMPA